jgi:hypothetical protein
VPPKGAEGAQVLVQGSGGGDSGWRFQTGGEDEPEDGLRVTASNSAGAAGESGSIMVKAEGDGSMRYSTDGGQTWSDTPPEGVNVETVVVHPAVDTADEGNAA